MTWCAAAATLLTACALLPLTSVDVWLVQAALLMVPLAAVGVVARRMRVARPLIVLAQLVVLLVLLTVLFARPQAWLGVLPSPAACRHLSDLVTSGIDDASQFAVPAPVTTGIRLLLIGGTLLVAVLVDALAVTYAAAAPAGLPLLALYSVATGLAQDGEGHQPHDQLLWFAVAGVGYLGLLLAEGRDRVARWGRVFGAPAGAPTASAASGARVARLRTGRRVGALALAVALLAPVALPGLGKGLIGGIQTGHGSGDGGTITAIDPVVALRDQLNQTGNRQVLSYRTTDSDPSSMYIRVVALDDFDGSQWKPSKRSLEDVPAALPTPAGLGLDVRTRKAVTTFTASRDYVQSWLPMPYPATEVRVNGNWRYEPAGRTLIGDRHQTVAGQRYTVTSLEVDPTGTQLADAPTAPESILREYTKVPSSLPSVVAKTAREVTAGSDTDYAKAVALQNWFTSGAFHYTTSVAYGSGPQAITRFLKDKRGFCVHFAFTMAAMARTLGIPARVAVGFMPGGAHQDGSYSVGLKDAHAWPELYFQGIGWTRFEPTPGRGITPGYTLEDPTTGAGHDRAAQQDQRPSAAPSATPSTSAACPEDSCAAAGDVAGGGPHGVVHHAWPLAAVAALLALAALALPALPGLRRRRARVRRLGGGAGGSGPGGDGERERVLDAWRELTDSAWDYGVRPRAAESPRAAVERLVSTAPLPADAAEAARRAARAAERARFGPPDAAPPSSREAASDVLVVRAALRAGAPRAVRLRATLIPPSSPRALTLLGRAFTRRS
jgi:transglutaminase-like putative cysteine protease